MAELPESGVHDPNCSLICDVHPCSLEHTCSLCNGTRVLCDLCVEGFPHLCPNAGGAFLMVLPR